MNRAEFCADLERRGIGHAVQLVDVAEEWKLDNADIEGVARYAQLHFIHLSAAAHKLQKMGVLRIASSS